MTQLSLREWVPRTHRQRSAWSGTVVGGAGRGGMLMGGGVTWRRPLLNTPFSSSMDQTVTTPTSSGCRQRPRNPDRPFAVTPSPATGTGCSTTCPQHRVARRPPTAYAFTSHILGPESAQGEVMRARSWPSGYTHACFKTICSLFNKQPRNV
jgi:hypothetical protein